jgi:hypothetical protein
MAAKKHTPPPKQTPIPEGMSRPTSPPPPKRKPRPRNAIVDCAPQLVELAKRMEAERARIIAEIEAEEEAKKNPVVPAVVPAIDPLDDGGPLVLRSWIVTTLKAVSLLALGGLGGIWASGGIDVSPGPGPEPQDAVSEVFNTQETAFRRLSGERAKALRAGELTSEKASADWMAAKYLPESDSAWATLLTAEAAAFGGEQWTAEKEAAHIGRYAR